MGRPGWRSNRASDVSIELVHETVNTPGPRGTEESSFVVVWPVQKSVYSGGNGSRDSPKASLCGASVMETCVLIPKEFSLALANDRSNYKGLFKNDSGSLVTDVRISVWSNVLIPAGTLIYPFQGSIRFDKIDLYSLLDDNDVSNGPLVLTPRYPSLILPIILLIRYLH